MRQDPQGSDSSKKSLREIASESGVSYNILKKVSAREKWSAEKKSLSAKATKDLSSSLETMNNDFIQEYADNLIARRESALESMLTAVDELNRVRGQLKGKRGSVSLHQVKELFALSRMMLAEIDAAIINAMFMDNIDKVQAITSYDHMVTWIVQGYPFYSGGIKEWVATAMRIFEREERLKIQRKALEYRDNIPFEALELAIKLCQNIIETYVPHENKGKALDFFQNSSERIKETLK